VIEGTPVVLIASVSLHEGRLVERALKNTGWILLRVEDADEAAREVDGGARGVVLLIDAGLLEAPHDGQWRDLWSRHPELGTVVRCLSPRSEPPPRTDGRTLQIHPDDARGMREAIRTLSQPGLRRRTRGDGWGSWPRMGYGDVP
jgi:hypothetical protein